MNRLLTYLRNVRGELAYVVWPSRAQAIAHTALVILVSAVVAVYLSGLDYLLAQGLDRFLLGL